MFSLFYDFTSSTKYNLIYIIQWKDLLKDHGKKITVKNRLMCIYINFYYVTNLLLVVSKEVHIATIPITFYTYMYNDSNE